MKQFFPRHHVMGFIFSLILSLVALTVWYFDMTFTAGMTVLIVTAIAQASVQLLMFMHIGETSDRSALYINIAYALFVGVVTILGSMFTMIWGYM
ncbi:cytochrome aa3 quinol oxidase subunit IV [Bacillus sp. FJAT-52991]|uniref:Quinol oxidase subunit 4 n=1 Tax=Bacillus kandeliae TaxID=3129297 RepID=A0ABZ2N8U0_9BACI